MYEIPEKLSPSAINTFFNCPFQFKCRYLERRPQIKTDVEAAFFGTTIHSCIDLYYDKVTNKLKESDVHDLLEKAFTSGGNYSTTSRKQDTRTCMRNVELFEKKRLKLGIRKPDLREKLIHVKIREDLPIIYGKPDVYFNDNGQIVDWKTGKYAKMGDALKIQGMADKLMLQAQGYEPKKVTFDFLVVGKRITIPNVSMGWFTDKVEEIVNDIKREHFTKQQSALCTKWCGYRLSCDLDGVCWFI